MKSSKESITEKSSRFNKLMSYGWEPFFQDQVTLIEEEEPTIGRVVGVRKNSFLVTDGNTEILATVSGKMLHMADGLFPAAGDWVMLYESMITRVLLRKNILSRGASGGRGKLDAVAYKQQVIAANLDTVFIVCGLDQDFNLRRIERYVTLVYNCGAQPVIVLTKADLHDSPAHIVCEVESIVFGVPVHVVSAQESTGIVSLGQYVADGKTIAMLGSSGAGKSTLLNRLAGGEVQRTGAVSSAVGKGRHTTTTRDLTVLPQGGMVIDNPGVREIAFWDSGDGLSDVFPEIERFAQECRFGDCTHLTEPGCRVLDAVATGELQASRLDSYHKMKRELEYQELRHNTSADRAEKERWKDVSLKVKAIKKARRYPARKLL